LYLYLLYDILSVSLVCLDETAITTTIEVVDEALLIRVETLKIEADLVADVDVPADEDEDEDVGNTPMTVQEEETILTEKQT